MILATAAVGGEGISPEVLFVLQLAVVMLAARTGGYIFGEKLGMPAVLGELTAGILIGPFALGALPLGVWGPLFPAGEGLIPVGTELHAVATLGSIVLLFVAGLETDVAMFIRYSVPGTVVGIFGVVFSFAAGAYCAVWFNVAPTLFHPTALFMGCLSTATSVGITARVLSERRRADSPEGVTIMAAAVLDDVIGIIVLAMVVGLGGAAAHEAIDWTHFAVVGAKALGFWIGCTVISVLLSRRVSILLKANQNPSTIAVMSLGLALLLAGITELAGLAMIIGAYIAGLALSRTDLGLFLQERLAPIYQLLVPVFFCVMGMMVDVARLGDVLVLGTAFSVLAILSKVVGCGVPALALGFNIRGGLRIGLGMLPRGEVALIIAGIGLTRGTIDLDVYSAVIMMTVVTTLLAPPLLAATLDETSGLRHGSPLSGEDETSGFDLEFDAADVADLVLFRFVQAFRNEEFLVSRLDASRTYQMRKDDMVVTIKRSGFRVSGQCSPAHVQVVRMIVGEELFSIQDLADSLLRAGKSPKDLGVELLRER